MQSIRTAFVIVLLCVTTAITLAANRQSEGLQQNRGPQGDPSQYRIRNIDDSVANSIAFAPGDSSVLASYDFEGGNGTPDAQGWTSMDVTVQRDTFFCVDDFAGLQPAYTPINGSQSLWCGARPGGSLSDYQSLPGYGNNWSQMFESISWPHTGNVTLQFELRSEMIGVDVLHLEYFANGQWQNWSSYSGVSNTSVNETLAGALLDATFRVRFTFNSSPIESDEDGLYDSNGAVIIDDIVVSDEAGIIDMQDFESETPGAKTTSDGDWSARILAPFGDFTGLARGDSVYQQGTPNNSFFWTFFEGSPDLASTCLPNATQRVIPYRDLAEGEARGAFFDNWIVSPWIDLSIDKDGQPAVPASALNLSFDVYLGSELSNLVFFGVYTRGLVNGAPTPWRNDGVVFYGTVDDWRRRTVDLTTFAELSGTDIQVAVQVVDMAWLWYGIFGFGDCHTQAYMFDNITVTTFEGSQQRPIFVDQWAVGLNNGARWADAFTDLQSALSIAGPGDEIWVAAGLYAPTSGGDRSASFVIGDSVQVFGGFDASEYLREQRDWQANPTILTGNIGAPGSSSDNSYHVVSVHSATADAATRLDGFTIEDGNSNGSGGGAWVTNGASPTLENIEFRDNHAAAQGGGLSIDGGAPTIQHCRFASNSATDGGGIFAINATPTFTNVDVESNTVSGRGAGMALANCTSVVAGARILDNDADEGGGIYLLNGSNHLTNLSMARNTASVFPVAHGRDLEQSSGSLDLVNSILTSDNALSPALRLVAPLATNVSYSVITGSGGSSSWDPAYGTDGGNNLDGDPEFVDEVNGNLRLMSTSPAVDAGNSSAPNLPALDLDGNDRIANDIDMGAYELPCMPLNSRVYVDVDATGANDGTSWEDAYTDLQDALVISSCSLAVEVWVAEGTYKPGLFRSSYFRIPYAVELYGGFNGTESSRSQRDWRTHETILSGEIGAATPSDNCYHVIVTLPGDLSTVLDGFTVTRGYASGGLSSAGGGFHMEESSIVRNTTFEDNYGAIGGGIATIAPGQVLHCSFLDNTAFDGAGMWMSSAGSTIVSDTVFHDNIASGSGGGLYISNSAPQLHHLSMAGNGAFSGSAVANISSNSTFYNSVLWDNPGDDVDSNNTSPTFVSSIVQGSGGSNSWNASFGTDGGNNLDVDPLFVDESNGDLRLSTSTSPAVDTGDNSWTISTVDLDGLARIVQSQVDRGAYEYVPTTSDADGTALPNVPVRLALLAPYPNPFNPQVTIAFDLDRPRNVVLEIYDTRGRRVRRLTRGPHDLGRHTFTWDGRNGRGVQMASGIYYVHMQSGDWSAQTKAVLLK